MKYRHKWKIDGDPGMYDTLYKCKICKTKHMESADNAASWKPEYGCIPPKEKFWPKQLLAAPDQGSLDLPNGCTVTWEKNEAGGRTYYSDEIGPAMIVFDTALTDQSTILAVLTEEARLQKLERIWEEREEKNK